MDYRLVLLALAVAVSLGNLGWTIWSALRRDDQTALATVKQDLNKRVDEVRDDLRDVNKELLRMSSLLGKVLGQLEILLKK